MSDLQSSWQQCRLPDNYPKLILANVPQIPQEGSPRTARRWARPRRGSSTPTPPTATGSPAPAPRPGEGIFDLDGPATDVFRDFDSLARSVTFDLYKRMLGASRRTALPRRRAGPDPGGAAGGLCGVRTFFLEGACPDPAARRCPTPIPRPRPTRRRAGAGSRQGSRRPAGRALSGVPRREASGIPRDSPARQGRSGPDAPQGQLTG